MLSFKPKANANPPVVHKPAVAKPIPVPTQPPKEKSKITITTLAANKSGGIMTVLPKPVVEPPTISNTRSVIG